MNFDITGTDHVFCICHILGGKKREENEAVHQFFVVFKKAYNSIRREVLYNILTEFGVYMKLLRLIKCVTETYSGVWISKYLSYILSTLL